MSNWKALVISTIRYLNVDAPEGSYELISGVNLLVGDKFKNKYVNEEFREAVGLIEYKHFLDADHLVVGEFDGDFSGHHPASNELLIMWLVWVDWLLQDSWLIKDNSLVCEAAFCRVENNKRVGWSSNGLFTKVYSARGEDQGIALFEEKDLYKWNELCDQVRSRFYQKNVSVLSRTSSKEYTRFSRFIYFISVSRRSSDPAMKISQNCSALESIFSTDVTELSHRLSERVALFLESAGYNPEELYQKMKKCYGIRSQITHGSYVKLDYKDLMALSVWMLDVLRDIAFKLLSDEKIYETLTGSNEMIETYFRGLLFCRTIKN